MFDPYQAILSSVKEQALTTGPKLLTTMAARPPSQREQRVPLQISRAVLKVRRAIMAGAVTYRTKDGGRYRRFAGRYGPPSRH